MYAKGSYPNNTNVKTDSDVDIAVQCCDVQYWSEHTPGAAPPLSVYEGPWTPEKLRTELTAAMVTKFGDQVDTSGKSAIFVESSSARVNADVVPCFNYVSTSPTGLLARALGSSAPTALPSNYSDQHLANGRKKNTDTGGRFKSVVRIMKRAENAMVAAGAHTDVASVVECLVYNGPLPLFTGSWTDQVKAVIAYIWGSTEGPEPTDATLRWLEVNKAKYLFASSQPWSRKEAHDFAQAAWTYLGRS